MKIILLSPSGDELIRLLRAWRFWIMGSVLGALAGTAVFLVAPPPYRARATVNVDFHLEQAWPQSTDREQFYYLERETRKLQEVAMSDATLQEVARRVPGLTVSEMRGGKLQLSQPGNGGWHFYADDADSQKAVSLASAWAKAFVNQIEALAAAASPGGPEAYITASPSQTADIPVDRSPPLAVYLPAGAAAFLALAALGVLFVGRR